MLLPFDCHVHTYYSPCADGVDDEGQTVASPGRYYQRAAELGLQAIGFADHFVEDPAAPGVVFFYKGSGPAILLDLKRELARLEPPPGCEVYVGCETETMSADWVGVGPEVASELDFVLVPTTHYHLPGVPQPPSFAPKDVAEHMLVMLEAVVGKPWLDAVAHPFAESESLIGDLRLIYEKMSKERLTDALGLAAENGVALEVNGSAVASSSLPNYPVVYREVVTLGKSLGVRFVFGSDAHQCRDTGMSPQAEEWILSAGLAQGDFVTLAELRAKRS